MGHKFGVGTLFPFVKSDIDRYIDYIFAHGNRVDRIALDVPLECFGQGTGFAVDDNIYTDFKIALCLLIGIEHGRGIGGEGESKVTVISLTGVSFVEDLLMAGKRVPD